MMVIVYYCDDKNMFLGQLVCVQKPKQKSSKLITNCTNKEIPKNTEQFPTNQWMKIWGLTLPKKYRYPRILQKYRTGIKFHIPLGPDAHQAWMDVNVPRWLGVTQDGKTGSNMTQNRNGCVFHCCIHLVLTTCFPTLLLPALFYKSGCRPLYFGVQCKA